MRTDPLQIEPLLEMLVALDWVARLDEDDAKRHVLLRDPQTTPAAPLIDRLLLAEEPATRSSGSVPVWRRCGSPTCWRADACPLCRSAISASQTAGLSALR